MINVKQYLLKYGVRPSIQRIAIMKYLMEHRTHPTVETIYQDLISKVPTLSRTTIYNTLTLLEEKDAIISLSIDSKTVHYDGDTSHHAHFMCNKCGKIYDMPITPELYNALETHAEGFKLESIKLYYKGVCNDCQHEDGLN